MESRFFSILFVVLRACGGMRVDRRKGHTDGLVQHHVLGKPIGAVTPAPINRKSLNT